jgi:hypothetical protein
MAERKAFISPYWAICAGCVGSALLICLLTYLGSLPTVITPAKAEDRCAGIDVIASAVRVQGYEVRIEAREEEVARVMRFLTSNGFPKGVQAEGLLLVIMKDGLRVSFIVGGCLEGMVGVDRAGAEEIIRIVNGDALGRPA